MPWPMNVALATCILFTHTHFFSSCTLTFFLHAHLPSSFTHTHFFSSRSLLYPLLYSTTAQAGHLIYVRMLPTSKEDFLTLLEGRYNQLKDSYTISAASTRRFNAYLYVRKLLLRKSIENDIGWFDKTYT